MDPDIPLQKLDSDGNVIEKLNYDLIENLKELKNMPKTEFINTLNSIQKIRKSMYDDSGKNKLL